MVHGQKFGLNIWVSILVQQYANTLMVHGQKFGLNIWVSILVQQYANTLRQDTDNLLGGHPPLFVTFSVHLSVVHYISGTVYHLILIFGKHV